MRYQRRSKQDKPENYIATFTYIIEEHGGEYVKIGRTTQRNYYKRLETLQIGNPRTLRIKLILRGDHERALHKRFASDRISGSEWFSYSPAIKDWIQENLHRDVEEEEVISAGD